jgi:hypothetical protein
MWRASAGVLEQLSVGPRPFDHAHVDYVGGGLDLRDAPVLRSGTVAAQVVELARSSGA